MFHLAGREFRLYPILEEPGAKQLFFIFRDQTSGKETYGAGRFLYTDLPKDGQVILDFNKAYNPPCVFTPYATCPLPPPENRLAVRIEAGERPTGTDCSCNAPFVEVTPATPETDSDSAVNCGSASGSRRQTRKAGHTRHHLLVKLHK